jgi:hypothetical protein
LLVAVSERQRVRTVFFLPSTIGRELVKSGERKGQRGEGVDGGVGGESTSCYNKVLTVVLGAKETVEVFHINRDLILVF